MDSLASTLKEIGLKLRVGDCSKGGPLMASRHENDIEERVSLNARGMALQSELYEGETTLLRIGQVWLIENRIF